MKVLVLGQGFNASSNSVGDKLIELLGEKDFHTFTAISAFASEAGVNGLSKHIQAAKSHLKKVTIIVGVDQKGTSKEALELILSLGVSSFIFYQPSVAIFHPKIYLFEGDKHSQLIIGSANLTALGLFSNVEAALMVTLDKSKTEDQQVIKALKDRFDGLFSRKDPNLKKITKSVITDLVKAGVVPTELERRAAQDKLGQPKNKANQNLLTKIFPKRAIAKIPLEFRSTKSTVKSGSNKNTLTKPTLKGKLIWVRRKLPASSVQMAGSGTNPTGGLRLVQDKFREKGKVIDQTSYFRNKIFDKLSWKQVRNNPYVEAANASFEVTIKGQYKGLFNLEIRHKPTGEAGQHNYTTSISWGNLGEEIRKAGLTGSRLEMYAPQSKGKPFHLVIS